MEQAGAIGRLEAAFVDVLSGQEMSESAEGDRPGTRQ